MSTEERLEHALEALGVIALHIEKQSRPNGTSLMLSRVAVAGINGGSIEEAKKRLRRSA